MNIIVVGDNQSFLKSTLTLDGRLIFFNKQTIIENFVLVKQIYQLTIHQLSAKTCAFVHSYPLYIVKVGAIN